MHLPPARPAEQAFKQAIEAEPSHSDAWNGLGVVSRDPLVKQHCFVRAVQLEHNPSAWANLGMLYLRWGLDAQVIMALPLPVTGYIRSEDSVPGMSCYDVTRNYA